MTRSGLHGWWPAAATSSTTSPRSWNRGQTSELRSGLRTCGHRRSPSPRFRGSPTLIEILTERFVRAGLRWVPELARPDLADGFKRVRGDQPDRGRVPAVSGTPAVDRATRRIARLTAICELALGPCSRAGAGRYRHARELGVATKALRTPRPAESTSRGRWGRVTTGRTGQPRLARIDLTRILGLQVNRTAV